MHRCPRLPHRELPSASLPVPPGALRHRRLRSTARAQEEETEPRTALFRGRGDKCSDHIGYTVLCLSEPLPLQGPPAREGSATGTAVTTSRTGNVRTRMLSVLLEQLNTTLPSWQVLAIALIA